MEIRDGVIVKSVDEIIWENMSRHRKITRNGGRKQDIL